MKKIIINGNEIEVLSCKNERYYISDLAIGNYVFYQNVLKVKISEKNSTFKKFIETILNQNIYTIETGNIRNDFFTTTATFERILKHLRSNKFKSLTVKFYSTNFDFIERNENEEQQTDTM